MNKIKFNYDTYNKIKSIVFRGIARINRNLFINPKNRRKLINYDFSIISNNCTGALITHDLKKKFLTPTVNLYMNTNDFIEFIENLEYYLSLDIKKDNSLGYNYPIGLLDEIKIHFVHYDNFEIAKEKWEKRAKRINYNNIYIMMVDNDGCTDDIIKRFENLKYKNKVMLVNRDNLPYRYTYYIKGFEHENKLGDISAYENILGKKIYDNFNYIKWINEGQ